MTIDKELLGAFFLSIFAFLLPLVTIVIFLIKWLTSTTIRWEIAISIILIIATSFLLIANIVVIIKIVIELIVELKELIEIRKEEKEMRKE